MHSFNPLLLVGALQALALLGWLGQTYWAAKKVRMEQDLVISLIDDFEASVPSGWVFFDGQGY